MNPLDEPLESGEYAAVSPGSTILKFSLIGVAGIFLMSVLTFSIGANGSMSMGSVGLSIALMLLSITLYVLIMIFAVKEHRDKNQNGYISLGKGMLVAYLPGFIMASVSVIINLLYLLVINPNYMLDSFSSIEGMENMDPNLLMGGNYKMAILISNVSSFVGGCIAGVVLALIISAVMKKDRPFNSTFST